MGNFNYGAHCYNPYHTDTLGWTQPAESFTASDLDLGEQACMPFPSFASPFLACGPIKAAGTAAV